MTPLDLLDAMKAFVERETKDLILPVRVDRKSGEHKEVRGGRPEKLLGGIAPPRHSFKYAHTVFSQICDESVFQPL